MAGLAEAAAGALTTLLALWGAFPRFARMGEDEGGLGAIVVSPIPMTVSANAPIGTVVGTISVQGGASPSYTFSLLSDALGYFTVVGNQLQVNAAMSVGTDNIVIQATGTLGDVLQFPTSVIILPSGYVPTYYFLGF